MNALVRQFLVKGIPVAVGTGLAYVAMRLVKNETRLLLRQLELQDALDSNSWKEKSRLLRRGGDDY